VPTCPGGRLDARSYLSISIAYRLSPRSPLAAVFLAPAQNAAMSSWRDTASAEAQSDLDGLLEFLLDFAQGQLAKRGSLAPFGAAVGATGEPRLIAAVPPDGTGEISGTLLISTLVDGLRAQRPTLRAAGIGFDVRLPGEGRDAISVDLEHREGQSMRVLLPYAKNRSGGIEYFDLRAGPSTRRVWTE